MSANKSKGTRLERSVADYLAATLSDDRVDRMPLHGKGESIRECSVEECARPYRSRGLCKVHYERMRRHGVTSLVPSPRRKESARVASDAAAAKNLGEPFRVRLDRLSAVTESGCWEWTGTRYSNGYARFSWQGRQHLGHRLVFEHFRHEIPQGMVLDHLCRNKACVNPDHLEPVTSRENTRRAMRTHCVNGHEFTPENTWMHDGKRYCRTCRATRNRQQAKR